MKSPTRILSRVLGSGSVALLCLAASCASANPYVENRTALEQACSKLERQEYQAAAQQAEALYAGRAEQASDYKLQRYYAAYVCAQAHVQAALHKPFLTQAAPAATGLGLGSAAGAAEKGVGSPTSHWVAASYYMGFAKQSALAASQQPQKQDDEDLLPPMLKKISVEHAQYNLDLTHLAVLRRLDFDTECQTILDAAPELLDVATCQDKIDKAELANELRPLIFYAGFAYMKVKGNPTDMRSNANTYHLGAQARLLADEYPDALPAAFASEVIDWVSNNKSFEFQCKCNQRFPPTTLRCQRCGSSIVQFTVKAKAPGS